ncbi:MAG: asparagine synthase (glutamine-hydrolyzing) [Bdellovibrionales bacterium]
MCGFTGFYHFRTQGSRSEDFNLAQRMSDTLIHRGPDHGDIWQDPDVSFNVAHRRLSILDLSEHGHQPMVSQSDRYVIAFNGEIYNHLDLRKEYLDGVIFRGHSDTETLLGLIDRLGFLKTLELINGMFAFVVWDRSERVLHCARDRFGKKPLYIGWAGKSLVFGSELKALRAHDDFNAQIDKESFSLYSQYGWCPAPRSIYCDIWQLQPGYCASFKIEKLSAGDDLRAYMAPYWSAQDVVERRHVRNDSYGDIVHSFEQLLNQCVQDRMISDVPLGAFLSGGIDSSSIVALMQKNSNKPIHSFTIGFEEAGFNEADHAREIAQHLGTDHHEYTCTAQDARDVIPKLPEMFDEPFADQSAIPTYLVSMFAKQMVTVALSGDGGDEMLGGYSRHVSAPKIAALPKILKYGIDAIPKSLLQTLIPTKPLLAKHLHKTSALLSADTQKDAYNILLRRWDENPVLSSKNAALHLNEMSDLDYSEQLMLWDTQHYLAYDILTKVDRCSMASSLEARAPLLDRRIFEFSWNLPLDVKIKNGQGKWLLREVLSHHVPREMFERPKQGFHVPVADWLRHDLRDWAEDLLDESTLENQGLYDVQSVRAHWEAFLNSNHRDCDAIWSVLMFQSWYRKWIKL